MVFELVLPQIRKLVLLGSGRTLAHLVDHGKKRGLEVVAAISPRHAPEKVRGEQSLAVFLSDKGVRHHETRNIHDPGSLLAVRELVGSMEDGLAISLGAAWIFKRESIQGLFRGRLVNVHGTRLPRDRGGGGFSWQILRGNRLGYCVIHGIDEGVDTGPILDHEEFLYPGTCRVPEDYQEFYLSKNLLFLERFVDRISSGETKLTARVQCEYLSTYNPRLSTDLHGWIDWSWPADEIERFICAFDRPYAGASTRWNEQRVRIRTVSVQRNDGYFHPYQSGLVYRNNGRWLMVAACGGELLVEEALDEKGESLLARIQEGDRLETPCGDLEAARKRIRYGATGLGPAKAWKPL
ncbi:MAG: hypothetical protein HY720_15730 [Planctomycetes bacterium]|nr:hypothetical protein [Planctomycetota bacterium]